MEIIRVADGDYERYEELLLQKDRVEKEAEQYRRAYTREFGELVIEEFELKVECIKLKKAISYCMVNKNRGVETDKAELKEYLKRQMAVYNNQLETIIKEHNVAKSYTPISQQDVIEIKKIYHRIAKQLHPDISTLTTDFPELSGLFVRVVAAYKANDLDKIRNLEILINKVLIENNIETVSVVIPDIENKILKLEETINYIITTEPYTYKDLFADSFKMNEIKDKYKNSIDEYKEYKLQLEESLREITGETK